MADDFVNININVQEEIEINVDGLGVVGPAGPPGLGGNFVRQEVPAGIKNGINNHFVLVHYPIAGSLHVFLNGLELSYGNDYTLSANVLTMINLPYSIDNFMVDYLY